jgi:hypothetical protein
MGRSCEEATGGRQTQHISFENDFLIDIRHGKATVVSRWKSRSTRVINDRCHYRRDSLRLSIVEALGSLNLERRTLMYWGIRLKLAARKELAHDCKYSRHKGASGDVGTDATW